jgi:hypothetical protein
VQSEEIALKWEWPAGRTLDSRALVEVHSLKKESGGLFGIKKSPSMANAFPDPIILSGKVLEGPPGIYGKAVRIRLPAAEAKGVTPAQLVGIGLVGSDTCVCVVPAPQGVAAGEAKEWLAQLQCK